MASELTSQRFITVGDLLQVLPFKKSWVYAHLSEIPGYIRIAGGIMFDTTVLYPWIEKNTYNPKPERNGDPARQSRQI